MLLGSIALAVAGFWTAGVANSTQDNLAKSIEFFEEYGGASCKSWVQFGDPESAMPDSCASELDAAPAIIADYTAQRETQQALRTAGLIAGVAGAIGVVGLWRQRRSPRHPLHRL